MSTVISVENVTKSYRLGMIGGATLKSDFSRWWATLRGQPDPLLKIGEEQHARRIGEQFWALQDVSFQVKEGEVLGIIGRNGAGKSTLLKILSQVTAPTTGQIKIKGRVASLLEVGTGFHPELTGRENIFLNGAILGMLKSEIRRKLDEIIDFSGIEEFIDTPVKRYSSGMYVRLAFAVAAHLEPEILIVDEVLAVGDAEFQKKCLGKMSEVSRTGRTVLFVSHNTEAVSTLCSKCIILSKGRIEVHARADEAISRYLGADRAQAAHVEFSATAGKARFRSAETCTSDGRRSACFDMNEPVALKFRFDVQCKLSGLEVAFDVLNFKHERLFSSSNILSDVSIEIGAEGSHEVTAVIPRKLLLPGQYFVNLALHSRNVEVFDSHEQALSFEVIRKDADYRGFPFTALGQVYVDVHWSRKV